MKLNKFIKLCMTYTYNLGHCAGTSPQETDNIAISVPKKWLRELCEDQSDEQEYESLKDQMFYLLKSVMMERGWDNNCVVEDRSNDYTLMFSCTSE